MTLDLSEITFTYDFFTTSMPDGSMLVLNKIDEDLLVEDEEAEIKAINIVVEPVDGGDNIICSPVIGIGNDYFIIESDYDEYLGKALTEDNMKYCTMELYEEDE